MNRMSTIRRDFIASSLRSNINRLRGVLENLEEDAEERYAEESIKQIEVGLRQLRKLCQQG